LGKAREFLGQGPLSEHLFLFLSRRRDRVKVLFWERDGMVIWYQRLGPAARADRSSGPAGPGLTVIDLALLWNGIDPATARRRKRDSHQGI
jgi:transposase